MADSVSINSSLLPTEAAQPNQTKCNDVIDDGLLEHKI